MIETFFDVPHTIQVLKKEVIKFNGTIEREYTTLAGSLPTVGKFARSIDVDESTIYEWADAVTKKGKKKYPEFSLSYRKAMTLAKDMLVDNGLAGLSPPPSFIFVAKNYTDLRDKQEIDHTTKGEKITGFNYVTPSAPDVKDNPDD